MGLAEAFDVYQRARGLADETIRRRRWALGRLGDPATATIDDIEAVMATFHCAETRRGFATDCRCFYGWAIRRGHLDHDPTQMLDSVRVPRRAASPIPVADVHRMLDASTGLTHLAIQLAVYAGLRVSEIAHLDAADIRTDLGVIVVRDGKGGKDATVPLSPTLAAACQGRTGPLFGTGCCGDNISARIRRLMRQCGVAGRPHDLRHTYGTEVARLSGGNLVLTAQLMRHQSYATSQRYIDWQPPGADVVGALLAA